MTACLSSHRFVWKTKAQEVKGDDSVKALSERIPNLQNDNEIQETSRENAAMNKCKVEVKYPDTVC